MKITKKELKKNQFLFICPPTSGRYHLNIAPLYAQDNQQLTCRNRSYLC